MADLVQSTIETMVPDMLFFMRRKIFTKEEIKEILKIRENFEYTFLRKTSSKKDYLKAIQYEYELEDQRRDRFKALGLKKQTNRDYAIIRRIIFIFDRLTAKYRHDIGLWKEYCLFCRKIKANRMFFKAVSNALTMNWESLDLWLLAVYYHFEINKDPFRARKMFLKALKMNNKRKDFWLEYFRFELSFLERVKQRKNITAGDDEEEDNQSESVGLEIENGDEKEAGKDFEEEKVEASGEAKKKKKASKKKDFDTEFIGFGGEEEEEKDKGLKSDETDSLAILIYESIIEVFPSDSHINSELLEICNEFKGEWIENVKEQIFGALKEKFSEYPLANITAFLEMRSLNKTAFESEEDEVLFDKVNKVLLDMQTYFTELADRHGQEDILEKSVHDRSLMTEELISQIFSYYQHVNSLLNPRAGTFRSIFSVILKDVNYKAIEETRLIKIFENISQFVIETGVASEEIKQLINYIYQLPSIDYRVFEKIAQAALKLPNEGLILPEQLSAAIRKYLKHKKADVPHTSQANLYIYLFRLENVTQSQEKVVEFLSEAIRTLCYTQSFGTFIEEFLRKVMDAYPVTENVITECFGKLFKLKSGCPPLVSTIYINKLTQIKASHPDVKKHLQQAVEWHPENKDLWLRYIDWEKKFGNPLLCPDIFQRAQRHIKDGGFIHEYTSLMSA